MSTYPDQYRTENRGINFTLTYSIANQALTGTKNKDTISYQDGTAAHGNARLILTTTRPTTARAAQGPVTRSRTLALLVSAIGSRWENLTQDIPPAPELANESWPKVHKLAREVKRPAAVITAGRDLHDIHTVLHLLAHWDTLHPVTRNYAAHRLRLLYVAITKG
jgi:hypothetical protein